MSILDTGGPAFPRPASIDSTSGTLPDWYQMEKPQEGMTLRDYFASVALPGLIGAATGEILKTGKWVPVNLAEAAYGLADAMLAARKGCAS